MVKQTLMNGMCCYKINNNNKSSGNLTLEPGDCSRRKTVILVSFIVPYRFHRLTFHSCFDSYCAEYSCFVTVTIIFDTVTVTVRHFGPCDCPTNSNSNRGGGTTLIFELLPITVFQSHI
jgi:hypothetical protein